MDARMRKALIHVAVTYLLYTALYVLLIFCLNEAAGKSYTLISQGVYDWETYSSLLFIPIFAFGSGVIIYDFYQWLSNMRAELS